jgi:O-antigen ligase
MLGVIKITKKQIKQAFFFICWISIILSINLKFADLNSAEIYNFTNILNILRYFSVKLVFIVLIFLFFFRDIKINKLYYLLLSFSVVLVFSYVFNCFFNKEKLALPYDILGFDNYSLSVSFISTIVFFGLVQNESEVFTKKIFYILLFFIFVYSISVTTKILYDFILNTPNNFYLYHQNTFLPEQLDFFNTTNQRVSGIARMLVLLYCFLLFYGSSFVRNNKINITYSLYAAIIILSLSFLTFCIWGFQSRGAFVSYMIVILMFVAFENLNWRLKILTVVITFILPIFLFEKVSEIKFLTYTKIQISKGIQSNEILKKNRLQEKTFNNQNFTSGRLDIWKKSVEQFKKKKLLGYGESGDRRSLTLISEDSHLDEKHFWNSNASNAIVYSLLSGGIVGTLFFLIFILILIIYILKIIFIKKIFAKYSYLYKSLVVIVTLLLVRTLYENGFSQFGIDFLMILVAIQNLSKIYSIK